MLFSKIKAPFSAVFPALIDREVITRSVHDLTDIDQDTLLIMLDDWDNAAATLYEAQKATPLQTRIVLELIPDILEDLLADATCSGQRRADTTLVIGDVRRQDCNGDVTLPLKDLPLHAALHEMSELVMVAPIDFMDVTRTAKVAGPMSGHAQALRMTAFGHDGRQPVRSRN